MGQAKEEEKQRNENMITSFFIGLNVLTSLVSRDWNQPQFRQGQNKLCSKVKKKKLETEIQKYTSQCCTFSHFNYETKKFI